jgi:hypothetical protein
LTNFVEGSAFLCTFELQPQLLSLLLFSCAQQQKFVADRAIHDLSFTAACGPLGTSNRRGPQGLLLWVAPDPSCGGGSGVHTWVVVMSALL